MSRLPVTGGRLRRISEGTRYVTSVLCLKNFVCSYTAFAAIILGGIVLTPQSGWPQHNNPGNRLPSKCAAALT